MRYLTYLASLLTLFALSAAAQDGCEEDFPLNVVTPDAALIRGIPSSGFVVHDGHEMVVIKSVTVDSAPRRIVAVVENGKTVDSATRQIQASVLSVMLTSARAEDSWALLTAVGPRTALPFGTPRDTIVSATKELISRPNGKDQHSSVLEGVLDAAKWLQPSRPGDSIILLTMGINPTNPTDREYKTVRTALTAAGIRLFGLQLGTYYAGFYEPETGVRAGFAVSIGSAPLIISNHATIFELANITGGFAILEKTDDPMTTYHVTDKDLKRLDELAGQVYKAITEYYDVRLGMASKDFTVDLTDPVRQQLSRAHVQVQLIYPNATHGC